MACCKKRRVQWDRRQNLRIARAAAAQLAVAAGGCTHTLWERMRILPRSQRATAEQIVIGGSCERLSPARKFAKHPCSHAHSGWNFAAGSISKVVTQCNGSTCNAICLGCIRTLDAGACAASVHRLTLYISWGLCRALRTFPHGRPPCSTVAPPLNFAPSTEAYTRFVDAGST